MSRPVRLSASAYRVLLAAFPRRFRDRFGPEIAATFEELAIEAWNASGLRGLGRLWIRTLADLARHGGGERMGVALPADRGEPSVGERRNRSAMGGSGDPRGSVPNRGRGGRRARAGVLDTLRQDSLFALRTLRRNPGFSAAVVGTIALGIGANTAIFTVVDGILLQALPFEESERVLVLCETHEQVGDYCIASPPNVEDWDRASTTIATFGQARNWSFGINEPEGTRRLNAAIATPGWFPIHGVSAAYGRLFGPEDMAPGDNRVVILSHAFWNSRFGADPRVVGSTVVLDSRPHTIIGVLPDGAWIHNFGTAQIWLPLTAIEDDVTNRAWRGFVTLGKLAAGASLAAAREEMEAIRAGLASEHPETNQGWGLRLERLRDNVAGPARSTLLIFLGAVGLVLLIACANVANLLLVRATARTQEFAVRASMGAGRLRLGRQLMTESVVLAGLGGGAGVLLALLATRAFLAWAPADIPRLSEVRLDGSVLAFAIGITAATAFLFGLAPALSVARGRLGQAMRARRAEAHGSGTRNLLVIGELALAVMLLVGAGLLTRGFSSLLTWDPGFDRDGLIMMFGVAPTDKYVTGEQAVDFFERAAEELRAVPGVEAVGLTSAGPLFGGLESERFDIVGRPAATPEDRPSTRYYDIGPRYFDTMGIAVVRGRGIETTDTATSVPVVVVNETFAERHFPDEEVLGQRIEVLDGAREIVGVVRDIRPFAPDETVGAEIYVPKRQYTRWGGYFVLRARDAPEGVVETARARLRALDGDFDPGRFRTLGEMADQQLVNPRFNMLLIGVFALAALALAAIGTYGVIAYAVASRTHEIGIRLALGARPETIRAAVIRRGMALAGAGLLLGIAGAALVSRVLSSLLYGISPTDPATLAAIVTIFALVALAACWLPAARASRLDPQAALRAE